ncbi:tRNA lysidine(34) synthetase TilS [Lactobacillus sp. HT06-2]|uniref:tRNA lysidine(34) synthetase TilS n=1 Tax=Lactobacillus sp. HT06-2 TaxID=2080222 RepID=UPI000CD9A42F|nr:tRNA lysidine(34) synthetase TilS [Lactobacillus sp. HT06-2]
MNLNTFFKEKNLPLTGKTLVVAASGGPDSMALVDLLVQLKKKRAFRLIVAHFDHQLRADSQEETALLKAYCQKQGLLLKNGSWDRDLQPETGIEAAARTVRYQFLIKVMKEVKGDYLLTAHHGNDLLENILLKFIRSGNPEEMNSLQAVGQMQGYPLLRPLLGYAKSDLLAYDQEHHLRFIEDSTNFEDETLRNRLRHYLVPLLKKENSHILNNAHRFSQETQLLVQLSQKELAHLPAPKLVLNYFYRWNKADLAALSETQRLYYWQQCIWKKWQRRVGPELNGFSLLAYQNYYYLWQHNLPQLESRQSIKPGQIFTFRQQQFILTLNQQENGERVGDFWSNESNFKVGSLPTGTKLLLKNGQHVKAKKMFAAAGIPLFLRPFCLTVFNAEEAAIFVEKAYQDQTWQADNKHYYLYLLKKV